MAKPLISRLRQDKFLSVCKPRLDSPDGVVITPHGTNNISQGKDNGAESRVFQLTIYYWRLGI